MTVQNTNELLIFLARLSNAIVESLEDGKVTITDVTTIFKPLMSAKDALNDIQEIPLELADLDQNEVNFLVESFKAELNLDRDDIEEIVEEGLAVGFSLVTFINRIRNVNPAS